MILQNNDEASAGHCAEQALWLAVLERAVADVVEPFQCNTKHRAAAHEWFFSDAESRAKAKNKKKIRVVY
jgi:hypothetical protein